MASGMGGDKSEASGQSEPPATTKYWDLPYGREQSPDLVRTRCLRLHNLGAGDGSCSPHATVIVLHGGYWKNQFGLDDPYDNAGTGTMAPYFLNRGFAAVEMEYRRRDHDGGGWPGTNHDILDAINHLLKLHTIVTATTGNCDGERPNTSLIEELDASCIDTLRALPMGRLILIGHSAGGCLALWLAHQLMACELSRHLAFVAAMAPVADLVLGHTMRVSDDGDAVEKYMKCAPTDEGAMKEYDKASPASLLPVTFPVLVVSGGKDTDVPPELVTKYGAAAKASTPTLVTELNVPDADHFDIVNAKGSTWSEFVIPSLAKLVEQHINEQAAAALLC